VVVVPFIARFGGKIVARGARVEVLEGAHDTRPVVMFEFPTMEAVHAFWDSPDDVPIKKMREGRHNRCLGIPRHLNALLLKPGCRSADAPRSRSGVIGTHHTENGNTEPPTMETAPSIWA
jgi:uncharacterized protein (DUF1330 family)